MSFESELAQDVSDNVAGLTLGTNLFYYVLPDSPNEAYVIRETSGDSDNEAPIEMPTFQIMARGAKNDQNTPRTLLETIYNYLIPVQRCIDGLSFEILTPNWRFMMFNSVQRPSPLQFDSQGRPLFVFNVQAHVVASS